ncbi:MAG: hypothetical protein R3290_08690 [Acidimicrobiia bacterium]|nr:hypothetical protein [Acidimicrobiia bacterium]
MDHVDTRRTGTALLVLVLLLGAAVVPGASAQEDADQGLSIGDWEGSAEASGVAVIEALPGVPLEWRGTVPAEFRFAVLDDPGEVVGEWRHGGEATYTLSGTIEGRNIEAVGDLTFDGSGPVSGTNSRLVLDGSTHTTGTARVTAGGREVSYPVDNTTPIPTLEVDVRATTCNEAYGDWAFAIEQEFEEQGFRVDFDGFFMAFRETEEINENMSELLEAARGEGELPETQSPLLQMSAELLQEYNAFTDQYPNWQTDQVLDLLDRTERLLNLLRNLDECEQRLFGPDNVEIFVNGLTFVIQNLAIGASGLDGLTGAAWQHLVHVAARSGALGPGAPNPAEALEAEFALQEAAEEILARNADPEDGLPLVNDETKVVMATAAAMGWELTVNGHVFDARATYEHNIGDDSWQEAAPGGDA